MTDAYAGPGPLGRGTTRRDVFEVRDCASVTFDSRDRIVTICVGLDRPVLVLKDPITLATLASMPLPPRQPGHGGNPFQDFTGGGYFYLDERDRAVRPDDRPPPLRRRADARARLPHRARRRPQRPARVRRQDRLGAARLVRADVVRRAVGHRRDGRARRRHGPRPRHGRDDLELVLGRRDGRRVHRHRRRALPLRGRRPTARRRSPGARRTTTSASQKPGQVNARIGDDADARHERHRRDHRQRRPDERRRLRARDAAARCAARRSSSRARARRTTR